MQGRTIASFIRTLFYGGSAGAFAVGDLHLSAEMTALLFGALLADYITWVVNVVIRLPGDVLHGSYDLMVNVLFAGFLCLVVREGGRVDIPPMLEEGPLAVAVVAFGAVLAVKLIFYGMHFALAPVAEED